MKLYIILALTAIVGIVFPKSLYIVTALSLTKIIFELWQNRGFRPKSKEFKEIAKIKNRHQKKVEQKHRFIEDQIAYIGQIWGYNKQQEVTVARFLEYKAYTKLYNRLTASLIPQLILLIEECNARDKKGCKADVNRRLRELTNIMREELKKEHSNKKESFETSLEVFDYLLKE